MDSFYLAVTVLFRPNDTFRMIQADRSKFNYLPPIVCLFAVFAARMFYIHTVHFPFATVDVYQTSALIEAVKLLLPVVTWMFSLYAITSVMGGQCLFREILMATSVCFVPYIILSFFAALLSKIMAGSENFFFFGLIGVMWVWVILLIFNSIITMNDYTVPQAIGIVITSLISVFLIWLIGILIYSLLNQLIQFIVGIITEIRMNFN